MNSPSSRGRNTSGRSLPCIGISWRRTRFARVLGMAPSKLCVISLLSRRVYDLSHNTDFFKWSPQRSDSLLTLPTHSCTYSASFSPHSPSILSSVSSDSQLRIYDLRTPASVSNHLTTSISLQASPQGLAIPPSEALTHDWNKYRASLIAAAGVDQLIRTFDIRSPAQGPVTVLSGHGYAVRKVAWSPHLSDVLLSASYDMTCRVWTDGSTLGVADNHGSGQQGRELGRMGRHTEFAIGVDWCLFGAEGWCASVGWDERLLVWDVRAVMGQ